MTVQLKPAGVALIAPRLVALALALIACSAAHAAPLLRCEVTYAGTTHLVQAAPVADPYTVPSVDIGGRFRFKAVMLGTPQRIDAINLYAYVDTKRQPVLIHQAKYLPPFRKSVNPYPLTGHNSLYASNLERELQYSCTLQGVPL